MIIMKFRHTISLITVAKTLPFQGGSSETSSSDTPGPALRHKFVVHFQVFNYACLRTKIMGRNKLVLAKCAKRFRGIQPFKACVSLCLNCSLIGTTVQE